MLQVRRLFTSKIDKFLRKHNPLTFPYKRQQGQPSADTKDNQKSATAATAQGSAADKNGNSDDGQEEYKVNVTRKYQGPATTLTIEVTHNGQQYLQPFTLDLVNSLHNNHVKYVNMCPLYLPLLSKRIGLGFPSIYQIFYAQTQIVFFLLCFGR